MSNIKKIFSSFLLLSFTLTITPLQWVHHLVEEHEEVHLCDDDVCVRSLDHECEFCKVIVPEKFSVLSENAPVSSDYVLWEVRISYLASFSTPYFLPLNKAPPVLFTA